MTISALIDLSWIWAASQALLINAAERLAESFKGNGNKRVNENKGQASKAVASTEPKKEVLSEGMEMKDRFKKLANLI